MGRKKTAGEGDRAVGPSGQWHKGEREERATEAEAFRACAQLWAERPVGRAVREERERNSAGLRPGTVRGFSFYSFHRQQNKKKQQIIIKSI